VLTSGNTSDEPQVIDNAEALARLAGIADLWLMHDRDIVNRLDDSVTRVADGATAALRRARGYAPAPLVLAQGFAAGPPVLAMGAELKSTFCLLHGRRAILSQHIGDLEEAAAHDDYRAMLALYRRLFAFAPEVVAIDHHPDYLSSQWGEKLAAECGATVQRVQHHHAHVAAALAEHGVSPDAPPVLGIVLDGLGMGERGALWGGEFLHADYRAAERLAAFSAVPLLGGQRAMREPWRNAFAHLHQFIGWDTLERRFSDLDIVRLLRGRQPPVLLRMMESGLNAPPASSAGRLFDAAAAILGIRPERVSYEGQAAIELEALAEAELMRDDGAYPHELLAGDPPRIGWAPLWAAMLEDVRRGTAPARVAARLHRGIIAAVAQTACALARSQGLSTAVLSGGVFQNRILLEGVARTLRSAGLHVLAARSVPANDGGIALGQAAIAAALRSI
jgi:hydrogenase maturation protein HypF